MRRGDAVPGIGVVGNDVCGAGKPIDGGGSGPKGRGARPDENNAGEGEECPIYRTCTWK